MINFVVEACGSTHVCETVRALAHNWVCYGKLVNQKAMPNEVRNVLPLV